MPNRSRAPKISEINSLEIPTPKRFALDNGIPVYAVNMGTQDVLKLELVFNAGRPYEQKQLVARATAELLKEGTRNNDAAQIAETIDFYGGSLNIPVNLDTSNIVLYCLTKHFDQLLILLADLLSQPAFPEDELQSFIRNNQQRLQVDLSKNDVVAYRQITEKIFSAEHPYGYNSYPATYKALERADLVKHFERSYVASNCRIFVSGRIHTSVIESLNKHLGAVMPQGVAPALNLPSIVTQPSNSRLQIQDSVQTAIRIGRRLFNRQHADYAGFYVLNTVLGGYFGSRLMTNIRENKGYTYNIFSVMDMMRYDGYFYIGTEVGNEFAELTLQEIYREMEKLQTDLIEKDELDMVRSYLLGYLLTMLDGAFNMADMVKTYVIRDVPFEAFSELVNTIKKISAEELRALARKYLVRADQWEVIVGA